MTRLIIDRSKFKERAVRAPKSKGNLRISDGRALKRLKGLSLTGNALLDLSGLDDAKKK